MKHCANLILASLLAAVAGGASAAIEIPEPWPTEKANAWYRAQPWLVGCNFSPSSAINQLEMWQAETFDPATLDRELGWAEQLGFTSVRVFLHHLPWEHDSTGFLQRIEKFLDLAAKHRLGVMFVLFDACWDPFPKPGPQRAPKPHLHNSGWVQCPGVEILKDPARHDTLKPYVTGVLGHFKKDKRVQVWDIFNEPDNTNRSSYAVLEPPNKAELSLLLLQKAYAWARAVNPMQPITAGVWLGHWGDPAKLSPIEKFMLEQSDVITFHNYSKLDDVRECVRNLRRYNRPILCTEYMARPAGSTFDPVLRYFKERKVGAYNWGFAAGKTQTIYPWDSWRTNYTAEPPVWFHDILRKDGKPYDAKEVEFIKSVTGR